VAVADGSQDEGELASVSYHDCWTDDVFTKDAKLEWLETRSLTGDLDTWIPIERAELDDFRPAPFQSGEWINLRSCFQFSVGGLQTKRDDFVYATDANQLEERIRRFLSESDTDAKRTFHDSRDRKWTGARAIPFDAQLIRPVSYRPLDRRYLYNHRAYGDFLRPELQDAWGAANVALYALKSNTGAGPAIWCHGLLPDYHSLKGSNGGYAFPLHDRRQGPAATNISGPLIARLSAAYGEATEPQDIFDAILALLSARSYTRRFAEDVEDVFPHIAFPADVEVFRDATRVGREIRVVETFARAPAAQPQAFCQLASQPTGDVAPVDYHDGEIALCVDSTGRITGIPHEVWTFAVSGYRVLPRWIEGRVGLAADLGLIRELRDVAARIAELIHRFDEADLVLEATLANSLTREELGFAPAQPGPAEEAVEEEA
jgi:predicted helicase